ncbi:MAG: DHH family phosphoesterase [Candidatus Wildermuthbacteria bacterium]|nr:DHH family phosphoesterase [Candidatus Wildermuthbacteria bacterium]
MEIKNLEKAAKRIKSAIRKKERIVLYGDSDIDGVSSVIILEEAIKNLKGEVSAIYFPDREVEGYGISKTGLNALKKVAPALLVAVDCGIGNFKEILLANKLGFKVIVVDHHEILDGLPRALIIVDPKQKGDKYPFKELAATAVVFKLAKLILGDKISEALQKNFLELVALATIADMMPKESENVALVSEGLSSLKDSWRPGIQVIFTNDYFKTYPTLDQKISKFVSILNVRDVAENFPAAFRVLSSPSLSAANEAMEVLIEKNERRKERIQDIVSEAQEMLSRRKDEEKIIFEGDDNWDYVLISAVASILCHKYKKPTFIFKTVKDESQGTVRTPSGVNGVSLMKQCKKLLLTYGGHPAAAGFRIKNENLEKFRQCLLRQFKG